MGDGGNSRCLINLLSPAKRHRISEDKARAAAGRPPGFQVFVFAGELPVDQKIIQLQPDHRLESFGGLPVKPQPALNQAEFQIEAGIQRILRMPSRSNSMASRAGPPPAWLKTSVRVP